MSEAAEIAEFEEQLRLERQAEEEQAKRRTKTDEDGTEYEWDPDKEAWFPRIDADFIAQYQLSYGGNQNESETSNATPVVQQDYLTYEDFVKFYYGSYKAALEIEKLLDTEATVEKVDQEAKAKKLMKEDGSVEQSEEANKLYQEYCEEYYKSWETGNYDYFRKHYDYVPEEGEEAESEIKKRKKKGEKRKKDEGWFNADETTNTNVYVSGLPTDITFDEFNELMGKAGMIMFDPATKKPKLKLYQEEGKNKGDGRCCYIKPESVDLAMRFLDKSDLRGSTVHVERATFSLKGDYDPKKRKKVSNRQKKKLKEQQAKLFDWRPDRDRFSRPKNEKTVVMKNLFDPKEFEIDPTGINEIKEDLKSECAKFGEVKKVVIYDRNPEGVATVMFGEAAFADECIKFMNKRWFAKRQISAETWDGKSKYLVEETDEEREKRLKKWEEYLEKGDEMGAGTSKDGSSTDAPTPAKENLAMDTECKEDATISDTTETITVSETKEAVAEAEKEAPIAETENGAN